MKKTRYTLKRGSESNERLIESRWDEIPKQILRTQVSLSGVILPWHEDFAGGYFTDYKIITTSGLEYFIIADDDWRETLKSYIDSNVILKGLMDIQTITIFPESIEGEGPEKGPSSNREFELDYISEEFDEF